MQTVAARSITASTHARGSSRDTNPSAASWSRPGRRLAEDAPDDPPHVDVQWRNRHTERRCRDRPGRVRADAGQPLELGDGVGNLSAMLAHDRPRRLAQCQRPAVVPEPGPGPEQVTGLGGGELHGSGHRRTNRSQAGPIRSIWVCWDMTSATRMGHGSVARRTGRSRRVVTCHPAMARPNRARVGIRVRVVVTSVVTGSPSGHASLPLAPTATPAGTSPRIRTRSTPSRSRRL